MFKQMKVAGGFCALLLAAVFLGDARQPLITVFVSGAILVGTYFVWKYHSLKSVPTSLMVLWAATFVGMAAGMFFSDSPGASVYAFVRYALACVVFVLAYTVSSHNIVQVVEKSLVLLGVCVSALSVVFVFVPFPSWIPSMNLFYVLSGHNHVVDLLLFLLPAVLFLPYRSTATGMFVRFLVIVGLFLSAARGAWIFASLYLVVIFITDKAQRNNLFTWSTLILFVFLCAGGIFLSGKISALAQQLPYLGTTLRPLMIKGSLSNDPRWEYWRQATVNIQSRPALGSGGGTFFITSKRLQARPNTSTWFAHSFLLETLSDYGLIGATPVLLLLGVVAAQLITVLRMGATKTAAARLSSGALIAVLYSFVEFNLSFLVVWVLLWAVAGLVVGINDRAQEHKYNNGVFMFSLATISVFYLLLILQNLLFIVFPKREDIAFYITPFDKASASSYLLSNKINNTGITLAVMFHKNDPEMLTLVADAQKKTGVLTGALLTRKHIISLDPLNPAVHQTYVMELLSEEKYQDVALWLQQYSSLFFPTSARQAITEISVSPEAVRDLSSEMADLFTSTAVYQVRYGRLFYDLGLWYLSVNPDKTRTLWRYSSVLMPELSYIWVERSSLEYYAFHSPSAPQLLLECMKMPTARNHCLYIKNTPPLPFPGYYQKQINGT